MAVLTQGTLSEPDVVAAVQRSFMRSCCRPVSHHNLAVQAGVVRRELVAVLTQGTLSEPDMLRSHPQAQHLLALVELPGSSDATCTLGACAVDAASGHLLVGQW